jgi:hypothetical protein
MWKHATERLFGQTMESLHRIELVLQKPRQAELGDLETELLRCVADLQELQASCSEPGHTGPVYAGTVAGPDSLEGDLREFRALLRRIRALVDQAAAFYDRWHELVRAEQGYGPGGELPPVSSTAHHLLIRG